MNTYTGLEVAVIGVSGRFPEADNVQQFWNNLVDGRNSIVAFSDEELREAGESETAIRDPRYVKFGSYLRNKKRFDSSFFDYRPAEAALMDPQIRMFHECCWEALEDSGYSASVADQKIGLFASGSPRLPWKLYALLKRAQDEAVDDLSTQQLSGVTFLSSLISYKLNLGGPVMFLQSACSSSLAAIHQACNSILLGECKVALAGGVTVNNFSKKGYLYQEGSIQSADGKCRPFDHKASGTIFGEGAGVVVLKRLKDAIKDQDNVYAIVKGSAINNDGNQKIGYTAPSVSGQVEVLSQAIRNAKIDPESISYVEAHGTGTELGDPIEVEALCQAFRLSGSQNNQYCALGSVKSNIGHLDAASGVVGFIKVAMALKNRQLPATLHYEKPNPDINFENSPFFVNDQLKPWRSSSYPLRAGVSSLGIGGTNVHIILEEAPTREASSDSRPYQLLTLSAKTATSLQGNAERLKAHLENHPEINLADVAYTLNACRPAFDQRATLVCKNREEAVELLTSFDQKNGLKAGTRGPSTVAFMFPGQGAQRHRMYAELYASEPVFKKEVDQGFLIAQTRFGKDLRSVLFSGTEDQIHRTEYTQPLLFIVEYALARLLMHWGIRPEVIIGHSIGEYVAACLSGVFSLKDALSLVIKRGELMEQMPGGTMVSVSIAEAELLPYLKNHPQVALAAVNSPSSCVVSGPETAIQEFKAAMDATGLTSKELHTSHAFHSSMMDEMLRDFEQVVKQVSIHSPQIPLVSNLTGQMASEEDIITPTYWVNHLRHTVRFSEGVRTIMAQPNVLFVEVGPGRALGSFVGASDLRQEGHVVVNLNDPSKDSHSVAGVLVGVGKLWQHGAGPDWERFYRHENRHVQSLPTYAFDPSTYEVDVDPERMIEEMITDKSLLRNEINKWFYRPTWKLSTIALEKNTDTGLCTLVFEDQGGAGSSIVEQYQERGETVIRVSAGDKYLRMADDAYEVPPGDRNSYFQLFDQLATTDRLPQRIVHSWGATPEAEPGIETEKDRERYFFSLLHAFQAARTYKCGLKEITVLTSGLHHVMSPGEISSVAKSMTIGLLNVIGQEYPTITTGHIDISCADLTEESYREKLFNEVSSPVPGKIVSYRSGCRWTQMYDPVPVGHQGATPAFRKHGVYLITGGLGGFGYCMSKHLAYHHQARLVLLGREPLPPRTDWPNLLEDAATSERIKEKIRKINVIENEGGSVLYVADNLSCTRRFSEVVACAEEHFGGLHGVFHAAGITEGRSVNSLDQLEKADFEAQFLPKVDGLLTLHEVLKDRALDFCLLTSSLATILGGLGFGAYAPASIFMDYFVSTLTGHGRLKDWVSVNFDGINFDEEWSDIINEQELPAVVDHLLSLRGTPQVAVSTKDLQTRLNHWVSKATTQESEEESSLAEVLADELEDQDPSNEERTLWQAWRNFFGRSDFGLDDNFFEIGGDSLKALTLNARISKEMSVDLSLSDFFAHPTIRGLARFISEADEEVIPGSTKAPVEPAPAREHYILSPSQRRLYFLYELDTHSLAYNVHQVVRLEGQLDKEWLGEALQKLVARHEILRTSFYVVDGQPVQKVADGVPFQLAEYQATEAEVPDIIREFVRPFDLNQAPLIRVGLVRLSEEDHLLMVDMHHIVTDGVSQGVLIRDFMAYYADKALPELRLHYKDYAEWTHRQSERLTEQLAFWKQEFSADLKLLELPTDYPRPRLKSYQGSNRSFVVGPEETRRLKALGEETRGTMFMTLLSVFNVFLSKLSNQADITVGTGVAGRDHADLEDVLGMFINTLAIRNYPEGTKTFREFLFEVKAKTLACLDHQSLPYEELIEALHIPRNTDRNPLFDVALTFQNFEQEELAIPGLKLRPYDYARHVSKFDIELTVGELNGELYLDFEYATDLFTEQTIDKFISYFQRVIAEVTKNPDQPIDQIDVLSTNQREELLYQFNDTAVDYPSGKTALDLFGEQVAAHANKTAVSFLSNTLNYRQLDEKSTQLAIRLKTLNVSPGDLVGVLLAPSEWLLVSILGVLKTGAAFVPIDESYPSARIDYMVKSGGLKALVTTAEAMKVHEDVITTFPSECVLDIATSTLPTNGSGLNLPSVEPDDLAYVLYTSGSTGRPKGVMITHGSLYNYLSWARDTYIRDEECSMALFSSISFDLTITSIFLPLISGNHLYVYPHEEHSTLIEQVISNQSVNVVKLTPAHVRILRETNTDLTHIKRFVVGGEQFDADLAATIQDRGNESLEIYNEYGPTEATVGCVLYKFDRSEVHRRSSVLIGKPVPNTQIYLLNSQKQVCPYGVAGEVYIAGSQVTKGYLSSEEQTKARLVENPYRAGEVMYKTGDLARWHADGNIEFLGRIDDQVKVRGYRIELGEIASQLSAHERVQDTLVVTRGEGEEKYLVGYYVAQESLPSENLRKHLSLQLPEYMVPNHYVRLENIPLTANGKVDRNALPNPEATTEKEYVAPTTPEEQLLCNVWSQVLGKNPVGVTDDFFAIGGDSIRSIQICSRVKREGYKLTVKDVVTYRNIQCLAPLLKAQVTEDKAPAVVTGSVPLTGIQHWFFERVLKAPHHFNQSVMLTFPEGITEEEVNTLFRQLQSHHDALRMTYDLSGSTARQHNHDLDHPLLVTTRDLKGNKDAQEQLTALCNELQSSINLESGPLMKLGFFDLDDGNRLLIVIHHLVIDGISWRILFDDIETLYQQLKRGETLSLPPKTDSLQCWSTKLNDYLESPQYRESVTYWNTVLEQEPIIIPKDNLKGSNTTTEIATVGFILDKTTTDALLGEAGRPFNTQVNDILLASLLLSVQQQYGPGALQIDLEGHGREEILEGIDVSRTVGWFTSIYPVVLESTEGDLSSLLKAVKEQLRQIPNKGVDYLIGKYRGADIASKAHSSISFNYLGQFDSDTEDRVYELADEPTGSTVATDEERAYEWDIIGMVTGGQLELGLSYSQQQYEESTIQALMASYEDNLKRLVKHCVGYDRKELTPSDLTYQELSMNQLDELQCRYPIEDVYPLSPMQEGLLFHSLLDEQADHYFNQLSYRLAGSIDISAVEQSLNELMRRYDVLRTVFLHEGYERPLQMVLRERKGAFSFYDVRKEVIENGRETVVQRYRQRDRSEKFRLDQDVLMRVKVYQTDTKEYEFIWSFHHILMDGWCVSIIVNEFSALYQGILDRRKIALPRVQPYSSYIRWLEKQDKQASARYWEHYLAGYESQASLPQDGSRAVGFQRAASSLVLDEPTTTALKQVSATHGVTVNSILQSAWGILLAKYNNTNDVVFGAVVSGRPAELRGIESMVGLFINTIPVRVSYQNDTVEDLLKKVQQRAVDGETHHHLPLSSIQSVSSLGSALLDHILVFENYPIAEEIEGGSQEREAHTVADLNVFEQASYDLSLVIMPGNTIRINIDYNANRFSSEVIERIKSHLMTIIGQLGKGSQRVSEIEMLSPTERQQLLVDFNATDVAYPQGQTLLDLWESQVSKTPHEIAFRWGESCVNYQSLWQSSEQVAHYLREQMGVGRGDRVGLLLEREVFLLASVFGILKAGAAYVPLSTDHPPARTQAIVADAGLKALISRGRHATAAGIEMKTGLVDLDQAWECINQWSVDQPIVGPASNDLAYVIYTSGSTGKPKGVMVEHGSVVSRLHWMQQHYRLGRGDVLLLKTPLIFDVSVCELFWWCLSGASVALLAPGDDKDPDAVMAAIERYGVTTLQFVPSMLSVFLQAVRGQRVLQLRSLQRVLSAGEALSPEVVRRFGQVLHSRYGTRLDNLYGPTEATVYASWYECDFDRVPNVIPIGRPLGNTQLHIVDQNEQLCAKGVWGELCIGGAGLARGYMNEEALTEEKFVSAPQGVGGRWYRTGDMARRLADGTIEFLGRMDHQVKIRGFRIELGEIEYQLSRHKAIKDTMVLARQRAGDQYLIGYYVSAEEIAESALKEHLFQSLPEYMVPGHFVHLLAFPLTPSGKVDRKALPNPNITAGEDYMAPSNETEEALAMIWSEVLHVDQTAIGVNQSFFTIGGDSIKAIRLMTKINSHFNVDIKLAELFEMNRIRQLADHIMVIKQIKISFKDLDEVEVMELKL